MNSRRLQCLRWQGNRDPRMSGTASAGTTLLRLIIFQQWHTVSWKALDELITQHGLLPDFDVHSAANLAPICGR